MIFFCFSINPTVVWVKIYEKKKHQLSRFEKSLLLSLSLGSKYGHLMLPGVFPDKVTPNIDFTNKTLVQ